MDAALTLQGLALPSPCRNWCKTYWCQQRDKSWWITVKNSCFELLFRSAEVLFVVYAGGLFIQACDRAESCQVQLTGSTQFKDNTVEGGTGAAIYTSNPLAFRLDISDQVQQQWQPQPARATVTTAGEVPARQVSSNSSKEQQSVADAIAANILPAAIATNPWRLAEQPTQREQQQQPGLNMLVLLEGSSPNSKGRNGNGSSTISVLQSLQQIEAGSLLPTLQLQLLDAFKHPVPGAAAQRFTIQASAAATSPDIISETHLSGETSTVPVPAVNHRRGGRGRIHKSSSSSLHSSPATFSFLRVHGAPGSAARMSFTVLEARSVVPVEVQLTFRQCARGQAVLLGSDSGKPTACQNCTMPTFSFSPAAYGCQPCPTNAAVCEGSLVLSANGTWQSHPFSSQLHDCPNPAACLRSSSSTQLMRHISQQMPLSTFAAATTAAAQAPMQQDEAVMNAVVRQFQLQQCALGYTGHLCSSCEAASSGNVNSVNMSSAHFGSHSEVATSNGSLVRYAKIGMSCTPCSYDRSKSVGLFIMVRLFDFSIIMMQVFFVLQERRRRKRHADVLQLQSAMSFQQQQRQLSRSLHQDHHLCSAGSMQQSCHNQQSLAAESPGILQTDSITLRPQPNRPQMALAGRSMAVRQQPRDLSGWAGPAQEEREEREEPLAPVATRSGAGGPAASLTSSSCQPADLLPGTGTARAVAAMTEGHKQQELQQWQEEWPQASEDIVQLSPFFVQQLDDQPPSSHLHDAAARLQQQLLQRQPVSHNGSGLVSLDQLAPVRAGGGGSRLASIPSDRSFVQQLEFADSTELRPMSNPESPFVAHLLSPTSTQLPTAWSNDSESPHTYTTTAETVASCSAEQQQRMTTSGRLAGGLQQQGHMDAAADASPFELCIRTETPDALLLTPAVGAVDTYLPDQHPSAQPTSDVTGLFEQPQPCASPFEQHLQSFGIDDSGDKVAAAAAVPETPAAAAVPETPAAAAVPEIPAAAAVPEIPAAEQDQEVKAPGKQPPHLQLTNSSPFAMQMPDLDECDPDGEASHAAGIPLGLEDHWLHSPQPQLGAGCEQQSAQPGGAENPPQLIIPQYQPQVVDTALVWTFIRPFAAVYSFMSAGTSSGMPTASRRGGHSCQQQELPLQWQQQQTGGQPLTHSELQQQQQQIVDAALSLATQSTAGNLSMTPSLADSAMPAIPCSASCSTKPVPGALPIKPSGDAASSGAANVRAVPVPQVLQEPSRSRSYGNTPFLRVQQQEMGLATSWDEADEGWGQRSSTRQTALSGLNRGSGTDVHGGPASGLLVLGHPLLLGETVTSKPAGLSLSAARERPGVLLEVRKPACTNAMGILMQWTEP
jgi:hypothetical protein